MFGLTRSLPVILGYPVVPIRMLLLPNHLCKPLVVGDDNELEVLLALALLHDPAAQGSRREGEKDVRRNTGMITQGE